MKRFLISFDLNDTAQISHDRIYEYAQKNGGLRLYKDRAGQWKRLPSTCVIFNLDASDCAEAVNAFKLLLPDLGTELSHVMALPATPMSCEGVPIANPPKWAKG